MAGSKIESTPRQPGVVAPEAQKDLQVVLPGSDLRGSQQLQAALGEVEKHLPVINEIAREKGIEAYKLAGMVFVNNYRPDYFKGQDRAGICAVPIHRACELMESTRDISAQRLTELVDMHGAAIRKACNEDPKVALRHAADIIAGNEKFYSHKPGKTADDIARFALARYFAPQGEHNDEIGKAQIIVNREVSPVASNSWEATSSYLPRNGAYIASAVRLTEALNPVKDANQEK